MLVIIDKKTINGHYDQWRLNVRDLYKINDLVGPAGKLSALALVLTEQKRFIVKFTQIENRDTIYNSCCDGTHISFLAMHQPTSLSKIRGYRPTFLKKALQIAASNSNTPLFYSLPVMNDLDYLSYEKILAGKYLNPPDKLTVATNFARTLILPSNRVLNPINFYYQII